MTRSLDRMTHAFGVLAIVVIAAGGVWEWRTVRLGRMQTPRSGSAVSTRPVKPPTTNGCVSSHFILSHARERLCSYVESMRLAITPSQPRAHACSHGRSALTRSTMSFGVPFGGGTNMLLVNREAGEGLGRREGRDGLGHEMPVEQRLQVRKDVTHVVVACGQGGVEQSACITRDLCLGMSRHHRVRRPGHCREGQ